MAQFRLTYRGAFAALCTVGHTPLDVQKALCSVRPTSLTLCTVATLRKRSFYYIGYQKEKSRTPPFKWTKMFENQTFSARFTKGSGCGLGSRNCGSLDATISLATVKKWAFFSPTSSMHGWLSESTELSLQWVWGIHLAMLTHRKTTHSE